MRCPQCQIENTTAAKFCRTCGTRLLPAPAVAPPLTMEQTPCPHCQAPMAPGAKFCKACGQARSASLWVDTRAPVTPPAAPRIVASTPAAATPTTPQAPPPSPPASAAISADIQHAKLICILGALQGMSFRAGSESGLVIGRAPGADVRVPDPEVSKLHAWVGITNQRLTVRDLKSTNGTFLNDRLNLPVTECELQEGDVLVLGRHNGAKFRVTFVT